MGNHRSDRDRDFLYRNEARRSPLVKSGKCARLICEQKDRIEATLARRQMTVSELAAELNLSNDTIRHRINEMVMDGRGVRVAGWRVLDTTMVRIWGVGFDRDEPKPVAVRVAAIRKRRRAEGEHYRLSVSGTGTGKSPVRFRREGMDEWLFRIRGLR